MASNCLPIFLLSVTGIVLIGWTEAASHIVGGSKGWTIQSNAAFYQDWAQPRTFVKGDKLVFLFTTGVHNVLEVRKGEFDACATKDGVIASHISGPGTVQLKTAGEHYFYCGIGEHCKTGQKLNITVTESSGATSAFGETFLSTIAVPTLSLMLVLLYML